MKEEIKKIIIAGCFIMMVWVGISYAETYRYHFTGCDVVWTPECVPDRDIPVYSYFSVKQCQNQSMLSSEPFIVCSSTLTEQQIYYKGVIIDNARFKEISLELYQQSPEYKRYLFDKGKRIKGDVEFEKRLPYIAGFIILFFVLSVVGIVKGYKEEIVFYYNYWDFLLTSISALLSIILSVCLANLIETRVGNIYLSNAVYFSMGLVWLVANYLILSKNSKGFWKIVCVVFGRFTMGLAAFFMIFSVLRGPEGKSEKESGVEYVFRKTTWWITVISMLVGYVHLVRRLVNGDEVLFKDATRIVNQSEQMD